MINNIKANTALVSEKYRYRIGSEKMWIGASLVAFVKGGVCDHLKKKITWNPIPNHLQPELEALK